MWGSLAEAKDTAELEQKIQARIGQIYKEKYVAWSITKLDASLEGNKFRVEGAGQLAFPVPGWNFWSGANVWGMKAGYGYSRLSPVVFIRLCHKFEQYAER